MECRVDRILFGRFFDAYDTEGTQHDGFFQSVDFSDYYEELDILTDVVGVLIDAYLYNEYSKRYVISTWAAYMHWDKTNKRYNIDADFYDAFARAFCGNLLSAESFYQITKFDWDNIKDIIDITKTYGTHAKTRERGNDTTTTGAREDRQALAYGGTSETLTDNYAQHVITDNNAYAKQESDITTENEKAGFNTAANTYVSDTKSRTHGENIKARTDILTTTDSAHIDTHATVGLAHTDNITNNIGQQTTTDTYGNITDRSLEHTDTERREETKNPDAAEFFELKKQLAKMNIYTIVGDAVAATMLARDWGC